MKGTWNGVRYFPTGIFQVAISQMYIFSSGDFPKIWLGGKGAELCG